jgi:hypothetical protein
MEVFSSLICLETSHSMVKKTLVMENWTKLVMASKKLSLLGNIGINYVYKSDATKEKSGGEVESHVFV